MILQGKSNEFVVYTYKHHLHIRAFENLIVRTVQWSITMFLPDFLSHRRVMSRLLTGISTTTGPCFLRSSESPTEGIMVSCFPFPSRSTLFGLFLWSLAAPSPATYTGAMRPSDKLSAALPSSRREVFEVGFTKTTHGFWMCTIIIFDIRLRKPVHRLRVPAMAWQNTVLPSSWRRGLQRRAATTKESASCVKMTWAAIGLRRWIAGTDITCIA